MTNNNAASTIDLSDDELFIILGSVREVLQELSENELTARVGYDGARVREFLDRMIQITDLLP